MARNDVSDEDAEELELTVTVRGARMAAGACFAVHRLLGGVDAATTASTMATFCFPEEITVIQAKAICLGQATIIAQLFRNKPNLQTLASLFEKKKMLDHVRAEISDGKAVVVLDKHEFVVPLKTAAQLFKRGRHHTLKTRICEVQLTNPEDVFFVAGYFMFMDWEDYLKDDGELEKFAGWLHTASADLKAIGQLQQVVTVKDEVLSLLANVRTRAEFENIMDGAQVMYKERFEPKRRRVQVDENNGDRLVKVEDPNSSVPALNANSIEEEDSSVPHVFEHLEDSVVVSDSAPHSVVVKQEQDESDKDGEEPQVKEDDEEETVTSELNTDSAQPEEETEVTSELNTDSAQPEEETEVTSELNTDSAQPSELVEQEENEPPLSDDEEVDMKVEDEGKESGKVDLEKKAAEEDDHHAEEEVVLICPYSECLRAYGHAAGKRSRNIYPTDPQLTCKKCKKTFHVRCSSVRQQKFIKMSEVQRSAYMCEDCLKVQSKHLQSKL